MTVQKIEKGKPLVISKQAKGKEEEPQTVEERLAAMEARLERIEELLKKALGD